MTPLLQRMREELVRRNYAESTVYTYLQAVDAFRHHMGKRLDHVGPDDLRRYHTFLIEDQKLAIGTVVMRISAFLLRFLYVRVLKRRNMKEDLPYPKRPKRLPTVLSQEEVRRLIRFGQESLPSSDADDALCRGDCGGANCAAGKCATSIASAWSCGSNGARAASIGMCR